MRTLMQQQERNEPCVDQKRQRLHSSSRIMNRLYFGDNLAWLRNTKEFPDATVDLVYLDPPFNSNADYNVLFCERCSIY
jgi:16S rRNA G966 N2-methylase RsmD